MLLEAIEANSSSLSPYKPVLSSLLTFSLVMKIISVLYSGISGKPQLQVKIEEVDNDSDIGSYNFEIDSNGSSEVGSQKSAPLLIDPHSSYSSVGSLLSFKKNR